MQIGGKERPVCVGWGALKDFSKETKRSFGRVFDVSDLGFDEIETLIFVCLKHGAQRDGAEVDFKREDIATWIEEDMKVVPRFMDVFQEELSVALDEKN